MQNMPQNRNFFITIALSVLILLVWQVFYMNPKIESQRQQAQIEAQRVAEQTKAPIPPPPRQHCCRACRHGSRCRRCHR